MSGLNLTKEWYTLNETHRLLLSQEDIKGWKQKTKLAAVFRYQGNKYGIIKLGETKIYFGIHRSKIFKLFEDIRKDIV